MRLLLTWMAVGAAALIPCSTAQAQPPAESARGTILEIEPPVILTPQAGRKVRLNRKDILRIVYDGDTLKCGPGGSAKLWLDGDVVDRTAGDPPLQIRRGSPASRHKRSELSTRQRILETILRLGQRGGSRAGPASRAGIYSPAAGGAVRLKKLAIQWVRQPGGAAMLSIATTRGVLWSVSAVDTAAGELSSELNEQAATKLSEHPLEDAHLDLTMTTTDGARKSVRFWLLPAANEADLEVALSEWGNTTSHPVLRAIGRAAALRDELLWNEAADEYEEALRHAPESEALLGAALAAHEQTGNTRRVADLRRRLRGK